MKTATTLLVVFAALLFGCKNKEQLVPPDQRPDPVKNHFYFPKDYSPGNVIKIENGKSVFYLEKSGDVYRLEGDILLTEQQVNQLRRTDTNGRAAIGDASKLWPGRVVPYTVHSNVTTAGVNFINAAILHWELNTGFDFVPRTSQGNYIEFEGSTENSSFIGMAGGKQTVKFVQTGSFGDCSLIHELGHAVGLYHEQSRADRNNSIIINWANIRPGKEHNFQTYVERGLNGFDIGAFDFESIMLYPSVIGDANMVFNTTIPTITDINGNEYFSFNFCSLSNGDIESVNALYQPVYLKPVYSYYNNSSDWEDDITTYLSVDVYSDPAGTIPINLPRKLQVNYRIYTNTHPYGYSEVNGVAVLEPGQSSYGISSTHSGCRYDGSMNPVPGCRWSSLGLIAGPSYTMLPYP